MNNKIKTLGFCIISPLYGVRYNKMKRQFPKVKNSLDSLDEIIVSGKSLSRFGDGELNLISGVSIGFQQSDKKLSEELKRVLNTPNELCHIGLPYSFVSLNHFRIDAKCFWLYTIVKNWIRWKPLFKRDIYLDTQCSRFYMDVKDRAFSQAIVDKWRELWDGRDVVIIEGEKTKMGIGNDLFNNVKSIKRIVCPSKNAFNVYDKILDSAKELPKDVLILIALGPTASVLSYDLSLCGYQAVDSGHMDLEYCWMQKHADKKISIAGRSVNEISDDTPEDINDSEYKKQIITLIYQE